MRRFRILTAVWALLLGAEVAVRLALVLTTSASVVMGVSPFVLGGLTAAGMAWTMRYARQGMTARQALTIG